MNNTTDTGRPKPSVSRISSTFAEVGFGTAGFHKRFHVKHEADRSWTLLGFRHGAPFEDGGYGTRQAALSAAGAIYDRERAAWERGIPE